MRQQRGKEETTRLAQTQVYDIGSERGNYINEKRKDLGDSELMVVLRVSVVLLLLVPTTVVFTNTRLLTMMKVQYSTRYESKAARYLQEHCIQPIQGFTEKETSHILQSIVSFYTVITIRFVLTILLLAKQGQETGWEDLTDQPVFVLRARIGKTENIAAHNLWRIGNSTC